MTGFCGEGYKGIACSTCQFGYLKTEGSSYRIFAKINMCIDDKKCIAMHNIGISYQAKFISFSLLHVLVMVFLSRYNSPLDLCSGY